MTEDFDFDIDIDLQDVEFSLESILAEYSGVSSLEAETPRHQDFVDFEIPDLDAHDAEKPELDFSNMMIPNLESELSFSINLSDPRISQKSDESDDFQIVADAFDSATDEVAVLPEPSRSKKFFHRNRSKFFDKVRETVTSEPDLDPDSFTEMESSEPDGQPFEAESVAEEAFVPASVSDDGIVKDSDQILQFSDADSALAPDDTLKAEPDPAVQPTLKQKRFLRKRTADVKTEAETIEQKPLYDLHIVEDNCSDSDDKMAEFADLLSDASTDFQDDAEPVAEDEDIEAFVRLFGKEPSSDLPPNDTSAAESDEIADPVESVAFSQEDVGLTDPAAEPMETSAGASDQILQFSDYVASDASEPIDLLFDKYASRDISEKENIEVEKTLEAGAIAEAKDHRIRNLLFRFLGSGVQNESEEECDSNYDDDLPVTAVEEEEEEPEEEPDYFETSKQYAKGIRSLTYRSFAVFGGAVLLLLFTYLLENGKKLPFGLQSNPILAIGVMLIIQLILMILGVDVLLEGVTDLFRGHPGGESLILFSNLGSVVAAGYLLLTNNYVACIPFCAISSFSLYYGLRGKALYRAAMRDTLRIACAVSNPRGVISAFQDFDEDDVLKKVNHTTAGFYRKLTNADLCEIFYQYATPLLLIAAFVLTLLFVVIKKTPEYAVYMFGALVAVSAVFSLPLAYGKTFRFAVRAAKRSGGAIAGWSGASEICDADSALITDEDLFPTGTASIRGIKVYGGFPQQKAITYTSSLIVTSASDLAKVFDDLLYSQKLNVLPITDFACYEGGGVGGTIRNEAVLVGSAGFMNLMGIRVPSTESEKSSIFTAVNGVLISEFSIEYVPTNSVQKALLLMLKTKFRMLMAIRDFNVTPIMIKQRFKLPMQQVNKLPVEDCYRVSQDEPVKHCDVVALLCREGLGPFAEVIIRGRKLYIATNIAAILTLFTSVFGFLLLFFLCWTGAFAAASPISVFIFLFLTNIVVSLFIRLALS